MEVIRARILGFCMGVRKAVSKAERALCETSPVYTLGPLIHNPLVLKDFSKKGLLTLDSLENLTFNKTPCTVIIRAHGTTPLIQEKLVSSGANVLDATCPRVHLSQKRASDWGARGYTIVIAGDRNHGEVTSIKDALLLKNPSIKVFNSICTATIERQQALLELKGRVDGIIVVGGHNSANTRRLYETALALSSNSCLIESEKEIPPLFFGLDRVGLTAGASTPDYIIDSIEKSLLKGSSL